MKPNAENRTGIENFNHWQLAGLPEYHETVRALNRLVLAIDAQKIGEGHPTFQGGQTQWLACVEQMAASLAFADCCDECGDMCWPIKVSMEGSDMCGEYVCAACGIRWPCSYDIGIVEYL